MNTKEAEASADLACSECQCSIDSCAFCDEAGCAVAVCYGCLIEDLGETAPQPHTHGG
jgi:hypothetical protein